MDQKKTNRSDRKIFSQKRKITWESKAITASEQISLTTCLTSRKFYEIAFICVMFLLFALWLTDIFINGTESTQYNVFFGRGDDFLADWLNVVGYSSERDPYNNSMYSGFQDKSYPPLNYVIAYLFSRLAHMQTYWDANYFLSMFHEPRFFVIYLILTILFFIALYEILRYCKQGNETVKFCTALAILISAPILFTIERANVIIISLTCILLYLFFYDSEKKWKRQFALITLAFAAALKLTPALLGILLLYDRRWKDIVKTVLYGILFGITPFFFFDGGLSNIFLLIRNIQIHTEVYTKAVGCTFLAGVLSYGIPFSETLDTIMVVITYCVCALFLVTAPLYRKKWEKLMAVCLILIILPSPSQYYCILYIIPALTAFLNEEQHDYSSLLILVSAFMIMNPLQGKFEDAFFNYHTALFILTSYLLVKGVKEIVKCLPRKSVSLT